MLLDAVIAGPDSAGNRPALEIASMVVRAIAASSDPLVKMDDPITLTLVPRWTHQSPTDCRKLASAPPV